MYRIELGPDDIGVFRSIEELATAIKTGVITSKARIYHSASDKWLPIEFHPHFKKAREMAAGPVPPAPPPAPPRVESGPPRLRTPLPAPSPVAGLPLIDLSPAAVPSPAPVGYAAPPEAGIEEPPPPPARDPEPEPAPVAAYMEPEPARSDPDPEVQPEPATAAAVYSPPVLPLPEPEREAIFLSAEPEPAPEAPAVTPPAYTAPAYSTPAYSAPAYSAPAYSAPAYSAPAYTAPAYTAPAYSAPAFTPPAFDEPAPVEAGSPARAQDGDTQDGDTTEGPVAEPSRVAAVLPAVQLPRVDLRLRQRRRPILIAAAAVTLAISTQFALSARPRLDLGVAVPIPDLRPGALRAERPGAPTSNAAVLPASVPAAKGSPSFGGASAFSTPAPVTESPPPAPPADTTAPEEVAPVAPAPRIAIAAPKLGAMPSLEGDLKSAAGLVARYQTAYTGARAELDNGLKTAGFANLFATVRLQPEGVRAARASVATASAYVQRYRRREAEIEQAYRDTFDLLAGRNKWSDGQRRTWEARAVAKEHPEVVKLSSFLLQSLDSLYGLLSAQEAAYRIVDGSIAFDDAAASRAYGELRPWLDRRAHAWAETDGEPTTAARILRAMGSVKLPDGGAI